MKRENILENHFSLLSLTKSLSQSHYYDVLCHQKVFAFYNQLNQIEKTAPCSYYPFFFVSILFLRKVTTTVSQKQLEYLPAREMYCDKSIVEGKAKSVISSYFRGIPSAIRNVFVLLDLLYYSRSFQFMIIIRFCS